MDLGLCRDKLKNFGAVIGQIMVLSEEKKTTSFSADC